MKKIIEDYVALQEMYAPYSKGNEFLTIPETLDTVTTWIISPLTTNAAIRRLIAVVSDTIGEALKSQQIQPKVLARRFNALWDILVANEKETKKLANSVLTMKSL